MIAPKPRKKKSSKLTERRWQPLRTCLKGKKQKLRNLMTLRKKRNFRERKRNRRFLQEKEG
jgi:hypothetical protein